MSFFSDMKIGARLAFGFALVLALGVTMTAIGMWFLQGVGTSTDDMIERARMSKLSQEWLAGNALNAVRTMAVAKSTNPESRKVFRDEMAVESARISKTQKGLEAGMASSEEGKRLLSIVAEKRKAYLDIRTGIFKMQDEGGDPIAITQATESKMIPALHAYDESAQDGSPLPIRTFRRRPSKCLLRHRVGPSESDLSWTGFTSNWRNSGMDPLA